MAVIKPNVQMFASPAERQAWIMQSFKRILTFTVLYNPAASYQVIKASYPDYPNLGRGVEQTEGAQKDMYDYLERQAENTGDAQGFALAFAAAVPANPSMDGLWLIKQS